MNLKKLFIFVVLSVFIVPTSFVFAEDLKIETGKPTKITFRGDNDYDWYNEATVYDNVNIGAGTKVVLDSDWEYIYKGKEGPVQEPENPEGDDPIDITETTTYKYANEENLATLAIDNNGTLTLNSGSELALRNQYNLITSADNSSVQYETYKAVDNEDHIRIKEKSLNSDFFPYVGEEQIYLNRESKTTPNLFTGDIVFENGDTDTKLTFESVSTETSEYYVLPQAKEATTIEGGGYKGGNLTKQDVIEEVETATLDDKNNIVTIANDLVIKSNRAVLNVNFDGDKDSGEWNSLYGHVALTGNLSGDGTVVKQGAGTLSLKDCDGTGLSGSNTGYGWMIEEGRIVANNQNNLGTSDIFIDSGGMLSLGGNTNTFSNNITSSGGTIGISAGAKVTLSGNLDSSEGNDNLNFSLYKNSELILTGNNNAKKFSISFGGEYGGEENYLRTDVDGLASESITVSHSSGMEDDEFAFFELLLNVNDSDENKKYDGSLNGDMYLRKLGDGVVTLSGNSTYENGTYITEGGILLASSNALGTGKIMFDGSGTDYASIGVSEDTTGDINLANNIHVKKGAILDVAENQNMYLNGDLVSYDPNNTTEFIKVGKGNTTISQIEGVDRKINISQFSINNGRFTLDKGVSLDSEFFLTGENAVLEMKENAKIKNDINIEKGDLTIFNEKNIAEATSVNFGSTENTPKLHITSTTVLSDTISEKISIAKNIEFVTDAETTAKINKFNFQSGADTVITKSGEESFIAQGNGDFALNSLYVNGGTFRIEDMDMTVSNETIVDGGILSVGQTAHFASTATGDNKKITVLSGGIGIYDDTSIDGGTKLSFEGTDTENLSKLVIEAENVNLTNDIYVKTGLIIENNKDITFSGNSITGEYGILAKAGEGNMIINSPGTVFEMGEIRTLEGNLLVQSDIDVNSVSILGENALLSFENVNNSSINNSLSLASGGTLSLSGSTLNISDLSMTSGTILNDDSTLNANLIDCNNSSIELSNAASTMNAQTINLKNSVVEGFGNLNSNVRIKDGSSIYVGSLGTAGEKLKIGKQSQNTPSPSMGIQAASSSNTGVVFESGSNLYIDVESVSGVTSSDVLEVSGDITVQKNVTLNVNLLGAASEYGDSPKEFEFLTFTGNYNFENTTNNIFDIVLSNPKLSVSTALIGNSIFLEIAQKWSQYDMPGVTKNQEEMINLINEIASDDIAAAKMEVVLSSLNQYYSDYMDSGNKAPFLNALQDLSGIFYSNSFMTSAMFSKANIIYGRLKNNTERTEEDNRLWTQVYTTNFTVNENESNPKFENSMFGLVAGYDVIREDNILLEDKLVYGIAGFYGQGELKQLDDKANVMDAGVNVYGNYEINENVDIKGLAGYSIQNYDTTRKLRFNKQEIKSNYSTNTASFDLEAGYKFDLNKKFFIRPLIGVNCAIVSNGDIEEDGNTEYRLKIKQGTYCKSEARAGIDLQSRLESPFNWYISAAIKQILSGDKFRTKGFFVNAPEYEFEIDSTKLSGTAFSGSLGCKYDINPDLNLSLDFGVDTGIKSEFRANIGASYKWTM